MGICCYEYGEFIISTIITRQLSSRIKLQVIFFHYIQYSYSQKAFEKKEESTKLFVINLNSNEIIHKMEINFLFFVEWKINKLDDRILQKQGTEKSTISKNSDEFA